MCGQGMDRCVGKGWIGACGEGMDRCVGKGWIGVWGRDG